MLFSSDEVDKERRHQGRMAAGLSQGGLAPNAHQSALRARPLH
jgi:hypothetical protein